MQSSDRPTPSNFIRAAESRARATRCCRLFCSAAMDLKSGCIFWPQLYGGPSLTFPKLNRDIRCDVAVIGSGISGALVAYHLTREGIHTVMVDRRQAAEGSTAASTGLLLYEIDTLLVDLIKKLGKEKAVSAYRASVESLEGFEPLVADLGDRCGLTRRQSLYLASEEKHVERLRAECEARRSIGVDVTFLSERALWEELHFSRPAALWSSQAFDVDPYRLTARLILRSVQRGLEVFTHTPICRCEPAERGMTLHAEHGPRIDAKKVVVATGYETMEFLPRDICRLASTYALVSQPLPDFPGWPRRCLIWETARPYLYMRTTTDNRAMIGGEDEDIIDPQQRDQLIPQKASILRDRFMTLMPQIKIESDCAWAGTFAQTEDGLPYIGSLRTLPHAYFALGYGGNGITFSLLAARIITDLFLGRSSERARIFGFERRAHHVAM
jgi:glycine/D-amino acid oxidase-like deaminating enzyme